MTTKKRILVCPLDWGLGHATRCIPIINALLARGCEVFVASSGNALSLLKSEFPALTFITIQGYRPDYPANGSFILKMAAQFPSFMRTIRTEHHETDAIVTQYKIDTIISDNRYGCWSDKVPCAFMTHQVNIQSPIFSGLVNFFNHRQIRKFTTCWVPDMPGDDALAGNLSKAPKDIQLEYIGHLSRLKPLKEEPLLYEYLAIISGPEPQRSIFEKLVRTAFQKSGKRTLMIKGTPGSSSVLTEGTNTEVGHLPAKEMNTAISHSALVISRPGYSTIMDLAHTGGHAIFIPTLGQTEQEYLGELMMKKGLALNVRQSDFDLEQNARLAGVFAGFVGKDDTNSLLDKTLNAFLR